MVAGLTLEGVTRWYPGKPPIQAVSDVSFKVGDGEAVGVIGESGCGKSTLARCIIGLEPLQSGIISCDSKVLVRSDAKQLHLYRKGVQMVWQNAGTAVNPRKRVQKIIREPLDVYRVGDSTTRSRRVVELLESVGLGGDVLRRYPHELSGGQLHRVVIARALALSPRVLVCDEPTAGLDVSVRAQIINLLADLKSQMHLTLLYISHDLRTVEVICDRILVMYLGRVVEEVHGEFLSHGQVRHPYTKGLVAAVPIADPALRRGAPEVLGELPNACTPPVGCSYHPRCRAGPVCASVRPELVRLASEGQVACHGVAGPHHETYVQDGENRQVTVASS